MPDSPGTLESELKFPPFYGFWRSFKSGIEGEGSRGVGITPPKRRRADGDLHDRTGFAS